jgi:hypothetical protein
VLICGKHRRRLPYPQLNLKLRFGASSCDELLTKGWPVPVPKETNAIIEAPTDDTDTPARSIDPMAQNGEVLVTAGEEGHICFSRLPAVVNVLGKLWISQLTSSNSTRRFFHHSSRSACGTSGSLPAQIILIDVHGVTFHADIPIGVLFQQFGYRVEGFPILFHQVRVAVPEGSCRVRSGLDATLWGWYIPNHER